MNKSDRVDMSKRASELMQKQADIMQSVNKYNRDINIGRRHRSVSLGKGGRFCMTTSSGVVGDSTLYDGNNITTYMNHVFVNDRPLFVDNMQMDSLDSGNVYLKDMAGKSECLLSFVNELFELGYEYRSGTEDAHTFIMQSDDGDIESEVSFVMDREGIYIAIDGDWQYYTFEALFSGEAELSMNDDIVMVSQSGVVEYRLRESGLWSFNRRAGKYGSFFIISAFVGIKAYRKLGLDEEYGGLHKYNLAMTSSLESDLSVYEKDIVKGKYTYPDKGNIERKGIEVSFIVYNSVGASDGAFVDMALELAKKYKQFGVVVGFAEEKNRIFAKSVRLFGKSDLVGTAYMYEKKDLDDVVEGIGEYKQTMTFRRIVFNALFDKYATRLGVLSKFSLRESYIIECSLLGQYRGQGAIVLGHGYACTRAGFIDERVRYVSKSYFKGDKVFNELLDGKVELKADGGVERVDQGFGRQIARMGKYTWGLISAYLDDEVFFGDRFTEWEKAIMDTSSSEYKSMYQEYATYNNHKTKELESSIKLAGFQYVKEEGFFEYKSGYKGAEVTFIVFDGDIGLDGKSKTPQGNLLSMLKGWGTIFRQWAFVYGFGEQELIKNRTDENGYVKVTDFNGRVQYYWTDNLEYIVYQTDKPSNFISIDEVFEGLADGRNVKKVGGTRIGGKRFEMDFKTVDSEEKERIQGSHPLVGLPMGYGGTGGTVGKYKRNCHRQSVIDCVNKGENPERKDQWLRQDDFSGRYVNLCQDKVDYMIREFSSGKYVFGFISADTYSKYVIQKDESGKVINDYGIGLLESEIEDGQIPTEKENSIRSDRLGDEISKNGYEFVLPSWGVFEELGSIAENLEKVEWIEDSFVIKIPVGEQHAKRKYDELEQFLRELSIRYQQENYIVARLGEVREYWGYGTSVHDESQERFSEGKMAGRQKKEFKRGLKRGLADNWNKHKQVLDGKGGTYLGKDKENALAFRRSGELVAVRQGDKTVFYAKSDTSHSSPLYWGYRTKFVNQGNFKGTIMPLRVVKDGKVSSRKDQWLRQDPRYSRAQKKMTLTQFLNHMRKRDAKITDSIELKPNVYGKFLCCIKIESAEYFKHGRYQDELNAKQRDEFVEIMAKQRVSRRFSGTNWEYVVEAWNDNLN